MVVKAVIPFAEGAEAGIAGLGPVEPVLGAFPIAQGQVFATEALDR